MKSYAGTIRLGVETDTLDADGTELRRHDGPLPDEPAVQAAIRGLRGEIDQIPPMYSAVKKDGVPLHKLAREGREVERAPKKVQIHRFELTRFEPPELDIEVVCSAGTYVRVMAADLGEALGCGAHLGSLRRTRSGDFDASQAATVDVLEREAEAGTLTDRLIPPAEGLAFPRIELRGVDVDRVAHGGEVDAPRRDEVVGTRFAGVDPDGELLAVLEMRPGRRLQPLRVLAEAVGGGR